MNTRKTVYLAGPILNCNKGEANDWRSDVSNRLAQFGITGISPLRCEPLIGERYSMGYEDPKFGTARAIASKNLFDVQSCDMTLAYLPLATNPNWPSLGTISELAWAKALGKPTILVTDDERLFKHPVIDANASWTLRDLEDAIEVLVGVLGDYAQGNKFQWGGY